MDKFTMKLDFDGFTRFVVGLLVAVVFVADKSSQVQALAALSCGAIAFALSMLLNVTGSDKVRYAGIGFAVAAAMLSIAAFVGAVFAA